MIPEMIKLTAKQLQKTTDFSFEIAKGFLISGFLTSIFSNQFTMTAKLTYASVSLICSFVFFLLTLYSVKGKKK
ncbi:MAG: hypothetical protein COY81_01975 [Candidatus Pacebacteria bacterium CG_4_10_14_0_8_um_filter_43_12]|nr:MAG: hypothetical protein COY81_01975 [Candidatus Pacebacteria bacterium CG_4_10_14_0_8_um_filter_43_12]